jgi:hypothetical protein
MITTIGSGDVEIIATLNGQCGVSMLHIAAATDDDLMIGNERYNNGTILTRGAGGSLQRQVDQDGGAEAKCTNCHGPNATNTMYQTVAHTPEQTGGYSEPDLVGIFTMGIVPQGGYFDSHIVSQARWSTFHQWAMTAEQAHGIVIYLRKLTPTPQTGVAAPRIRNFDGGMRGGRGGGGMEASTMPAPESGTGEEPSPTPAPDAPAADGPATGTEDAATPADGGGGG